jgi:hypothetical protein
MNRNDKNLLNKCDIPLLKEFKTLTLEAMYKHFRANTLLCFSPTVMIATIIIELGFALFLSMKYMLQTPLRLIVTILIFLAAFQLAEFHVCAISPSDLVWSRLGYAFITTLPPLGIHLAVKLRGEKNNILVGTSYAVGAALILSFVFLPTRFNAGVCTGNYVIFLLEQPLQAVYQLYYLGFELIGLVLALLPLKKKKAPKRYPILLLALGYLSIMIPTVVIYELLPATKVAIPSIMCGFAVIMAIILGGFIAPRIGKERKGLLNGYQFNVKN